MCLKEDLDLYKLGREHLSSVQCTTLVVVGVCPFCSHRCNFAWKLGRGPGLFLLERGNIVSMEKLMSWLDSDLLLNWRNAWNIFGMKIECFIKPFPVFKFQLHLGFASKPRGRSTERSSRSKSFGWRLVLLLHFTATCNLQNVCNVCKLRDELSDVISIF